MKTIGNVLGSAVNEDLIGSALRDRMTLTEAVKIINEMEAYVKIALRGLQNQKFQQALVVGRRPIYDDLKSYEAAISLLIERGRTDLLERCRKIYELACKAEPLVKQAISNCKKIGETEAKGSVWASHIKVYWEDIISPILQTNSQAKAETTPQKQGNKPQQVPSWANTDEAKRVFEKAVARDYMRPLAYGYKWKLNSALLAYFVERLSNANILNQYPDKEACAYFHAKGLRQRRQYYLNIPGGKPKNFDKIDALFE